MKKLRTILQSFWWIHLHVFLGFFALFGYLVQERKFLIFFTVLAFTGAICGSFIKVIDTVKN